MSVMQRRVSKETVETPSPTLELSAPRELPTGPGAAVILACGIGVFVLGVLTTASEASKSFADSLNWNGGVGPLAGKTILACAAFLGAWALLGGLWRRSNPHLRPIVWTSTALIALGLLGTFPLFFGLFEVG